MQWWPVDLNHKSRKQFVELPNDHFLPEESPTCLVGLTSAGNIAFLSQQIDWSSLSKFSVGMVIFFFSVSVSAFLSKPTKDLASEIESVGPGS